MQILIVYQSEYLIYQFLMDVRHRFFQDARLDSPNNRVSRLEETDPITVYIILNNHHYKLVFPLHSCLETYLNGSG